jgi:hypothetical protein
VLLCLPLIVSAASHQENGSHGYEKATEMDSNAEMKHNDHGDSSHHAGTEASAGSMVIVGSMVSKGVKGMAHLKDVTETMAAMGMKTTHHFMIAFVDVTTGEQIESGTVALKITNPDAKVGEVVELVGMDGHFGADVTLEMAGEYHFKLDTKLVDGQKRKYHFHQVVK